MRKVIYAGTAFYTGDRISAAILEYASALARQGMSETAFVPARTVTGEFGDVEVLLGPASQLVSEPSDKDWDDIVDDEFAQHLEQSSAKLAPMRPGFLPENQATSQWDDF
ncbi:hypothetical protein [Leifsonia poae]|uniref:Uncharacterized protein n=1 Tax=Leifsonia poae TaxID=110933 RepID=A0A9W6HBH2_9MICO|nr:hypothetical protein [Leifsonia poae]GLJ76857.1 hypothetical protein GCM10017584_24310 [Leifsonia poae]